MADVTGAAKETQSVTYHIAVTYAEGSLDTSQSGTFLFENSVNNSVCLTSNLVGRRMSGISVARNEHHRFTTLGGMVTPSRTSELQNVEMIPHSPSECWNAGTAVDVDGTSSTQHNKATTQLTLLDLSPLAQRCIKACFMR